MYVCMYVCIFTLLEMSQKMQRMLQNVKGKERKKERKKLPLGTCRVVLFLAPQLHSRTRYISATIHMLQIKYSLFVLVSFDSDESDVTTTNTHLFIARIASSLNFLDGVS